MKTGFTGTFVISWSQTELDGLASAPTDALRIGAAWSWHGDSLRLDGPPALLTVHPPLPPGLFLRLLPPEYPSEHPSENPLRRSTRLEP